MGFGATVGEREEIGGGGLVVPAGHYIFDFSVGSKPDVTDVKEDGTGGTPFIDLTGLIVGEGFELEGEEVNRRLYLTPGKIKYDDKTGNEYVSNFIKTLLSKCRTLSGLASDDAAATKRGYGDPQRIAGQTDKQHAAATRLAFAQFYHGLDPAERMGMMLETLRVDQWNGKRAVAHVDVETRHVVTNEDGLQKAFDEYDEAALYCEAEGLEADEAIKSYSNNSWNGFFPLDHGQYGEKYVLNVGYPKAERILAQEAEAASAAV